MRNALLCILCWLLLFPADSFGAIAATAVWEVESGGSDTNGGGFDLGAGSCGTDYSQQSAAQQAYTDLTIGATTTQLTSAAHPFGSTSTCNFLQITGTVSGTCTTGVYEIVSDSTITVTLDRSAGTAASVCNGNLGGSLASLGKVTSSG
jgi:hypothetical protein